MERHYATLPPALKLHMHNIHQRMKAHGPRDLARGVMPKPHFHSLHTLTDSATFCSHSPLLIPYHNKREIQSVLLCIRHS